MQLLVVLLPESGHGSSISPKFGRRRCEFCRQRSTSGQCSPNLGRARPKLAKVSAHTFPNCGRSHPNSPEFGQDSIGCSQFWTEFDRTRRISIQFGIGPVWADFGWAWPTSAGFGATRGDVGQVCSGSGQILVELDRIWAEINHLWPNATDGGGTSRTETLIEEHGVHMGRGLSIGGSPSCRGGRGCFSPLHLSMGVGCCVTAICPQCALGFARASLVT